MKKSNLKLIQNPALRKLIDKGYIPSPAYYKWLALRERIIAQTTEEERTNVEKIIYKKYYSLCKNAKKNNSWFSIKDIMLIKEIKQYFDTVVIVSQRGIGKSYSLKNFLNYVVKNNMGTFVVLRSSVKAKDRQIDNFKEKWFAENNWACLKTTGQIFSSEKQKRIFLNKNPSIKNNTKSKAKIKTEIGDGIVGYVESLKQSTGVRSIDKQECKWLIYEEFPEWDSAKSQVNSYVDYLETLVRNKDGFKSIFFANYSDIENEILRHLGITPDIINQESIRFNWYAGAIIFHIEEGIFRQTTDHITNSQKFAAAHPETYLRQQGAVYEKTGNFQLADMLNLKELKPLYHIKINDISYNFFKNGKKYLIADNNFIQLEKSKNIQNIVLFHKDLLSYPEFKLASLEFSKNLVNLHLAKKIEYHTANINRGFRDALDIINKISRKPKGSFIEKIK